jgi:hypothetical protein
MSEEQVSSPVDDVVPSPEEEMAEAFREAFNEPPTDSQDDPGETSPDQGTDGDTGQQVEESPAGQEPPEEDQAVIEKKARGYDSMSGRLKKEEDELRKKAAEYESIVERLRRTQEQRKTYEQQIAQAQAVQQQPPQDMRPVQIPPEHLQPIAIPEDIADEAKDFEREFPHLAPLLRYPGPEGERLRKLLGEYGPDVASIHAQSVMDRYLLGKAQAELAQKMTTSEQQAYQQQQEMQARLENERKNQHYNHIYKAVPEYAEIATDPSRRSELETYHAALTEWVDSKPAREARGMFEILQQGDAVSVVNVLRQFSQENQYTGRQIASPSRQTAARAAAAVPSRATAPPRGRADPNDEYAAFREAFGSR